MTNTPAPTERTAMPTDMHVVHICSFSSDVAELKKKDRSMSNACAALMRNPRVSCFEMSDKPWLPAMINDLERIGFVVRVQEPYPWVRYEVTRAGRRCAGVPDAAMAEERGE